MLQGCKWHKPEGCPGPRLYCPFCLVLPCLTVLQKISNHLELLKGADTANETYTSSLKHDDQHSAQVVARAEGTALPSFFICSVARQYHACS